MLFASQLHLIEIEIEIEMWMVEIEKMWVEIEKMWVEIGEMWVEIGEMFVWFVWMVEIGNRVVAVFVVWMMWMVEMDKLVFVVLVFLSMMFDYKEVVVVDKVEVVVEAAMVAFEAILQDAIQLLE